MPRKYPGPSSNKMADPAKEIKADTPEEIKKLKTEELTALAAKRGVDISECKNNTERADAIIAAMGGKGSE